MSAQLHPYSGSHRVDDNSIRLLGHMTFADLVAKFYNCPIQVNVTRSAFLAMPEEEQKRVKSVAYITSCSFTDYSGSRCNSNAAALELAFLDIDSGDLAKQIWDAPDILAEQLGGINFLLHTTATHVPENPRLRLIVDIETMPCNMHKAVISYISRLLGVKTWKGIDESSRLSQAMYRSVIFLGETEPPIISSRTSGRALSKAEVSAILAQDELVEAPTRTFGLGPPPTEESIEFMRLNVSLEEVKQALYAISPDCDRRTWYEVAASLRHQFRSSEEDSAAFEMFDAWSEQGDKYPSGGTNDVYYLWRSFKPFRAGLPPVTIRTLFFYAVAAGWKIAPTQDRLMAEFTEWVNNQTSATELINTFAARIKSMPALSTIVKKTLCSKVTSRYNQLTGTKMSLSSTVAQLDEDTRKAIREEKTDDTPAWLRPFVYVSNDNRFVNTTNMVEYVAEAFNFTFNEHMMLEDADGGRPPIMATDYAANVIKIPKVVAKIYDPRYNGSEPIFTFKGISYLNTYMNSYPEPDATTSELAGNIMKAHLAALIAEPENQLQLLDWMAHQVQKPGVKIRYAPLIQSVQGAGKGLMLEAMKGALGPTNVKSVSNNIISSQWSDWMMGAQLICLEELHVQGQSRKAVMNGIKEFLTNDRIPINKRNTTAFEIDNVCNCIMFTNEEAAAAIDAGERRYFVLKSPLRTREQVEALAQTGHFKQLARLGDPKDLAPGFRHFLLNYPIRPCFNANGVAPRTSYMDEMVADSESSGVSLIRELMEDPEHPYITAEFISVKHLTQQLGCGGPQPARYLRELNFEQVCRMRLPGLGYQTQIWAPRGSTEASVKAAIKKITPNTTEL